MSRIDWLLVGGVMVLCALDALVLTWVPFS